MEKTAHFALVVKFESGLLETADSDQLAQEPDFLVRAKTRINRQFRVIDAIGCGICHSYSQGC